MNGLTARTVIAITTTRTVTRKGSTGERPQPRAKPTSQKANPAVRAISTPMSGEAGYRNGATGQRGGDAKRLRTFVTALNAASIAFSPPDPV